jgi:putative Mg2+ transporter-C (MgtC) family protein
MLTLSQMVVRFIIALLLGALMGLERERLGKEAGFRTSMLLSGGAALFTLAGIALPHVVIPGVDPSLWPNIPDRVVANIVVGMGFLGAGIIIQTGVHVRGLTTAALMWTVSAIGILAGLGLFWFAFIATLIITGMLYVTRILDLRSKVRPHKHDID